MNKIKLTLLIMLLISSSFLHGMEKEKDSSWVLVLEQVLMFIAEYSGMPLVLKKRIIYPGHLPLHLK
jgi:hypothetical protein